MTSVFPQDLHKNIAKKISLIYSLEESDSLAYLLLENLYDLTKTQVLLNSKKAVALEILDEPLDRLLKNEPIQHILCEAEFYGRKYRVNKNTLVPRQETEELVRLIVAENDIDSPYVLDIGTGSGCIAISLALEIPTTKVSAIDVSPEALSKAQQNAQLLGAQINFQRLDVRTEWEPQKLCDIIVSNPPYVLESEKKEMHKNVLEFDPHLALFVTDSDPLVFYKAIAKKASKFLNLQGKLYVEINEQFGKEVSKLFTFYSFENVRIIQDLNGKDRFVSGQLNKNK